MQYAVKTSYSCLLKELCFLKSRVSGANDHMTITCTCIYTVYVYVYNICILTCAYIYVNDVSIFFLARFSFNARLCDYWSDVQFMDYVHVYTCTCTYMYTNWDSNACTCIMTMYVHCLGVHTL